MKNGNAGARRCEICASTRKVAQRDGTRRRPAGPMLCRKCWRKLPANIAKRAALAARGSRGGNDGMAEGGNTPRGLCAACGGGKLSTGAAVRIVGDRPICWGCRLDAMYGKALDSLSIAAPGATLKQAKQVVTMERCMRCNCRDRRLRAYQVLANPRRLRVLCRPCRNAERMGSVSVQDAA